MCVWQGTLIALASFSEGRLVSQLRSAALLSPIAYLSHMNTALGVLAAKSFVGEVLKICNFTIIMSINQLNNMAKFILFCLQVTTLFGLAEFNPKG